MWRQRGLTSKALRTAVDVLFSSEVELNKQLELGAVAQDTNIRRSDGSSTSLPGQPRVALTESMDLKHYLAEENSTTELDTLAPKLWLVSTTIQSNDSSRIIGEIKVSTPRYWHISPLHHQVVRGRKIIVIENPQLHLVWYYDRIYIKPIPRYLLSHAFWEFLTTQPVELRRAITGFVRTYSYLIRYKCDFRLATSDEHQLVLIPKDDGSITADGSDHITFERFARFIAAFQKLPDDSVSPRYRYGELRLSRLNMCARIFLRKLTFHHIDAQWGAYLGRFLAPILSVFAVLSVALSAMQVELGVQGSLQDSLPKWTNFAYVSRWFSCLVLVIIVIIVIFFSLMVAFMVLHDIWFARSVLRQRRQAPAKISNKFKSGVV